MSNRTKNRRKSNVHLSRKERKLVKEYLVLKEGTKCCWCKEEMEIPINGKAVVNLDDMATIEHYFAVKAGQPDNINLFKLSHHRCNK